MAHLGGGAVAVVGHRFDDDGDTRRAIAFVGDGLVVIGVAGAERLVDRTLDVVIRHIGGFRLGDDSCEAGIVIGVAAAALFDGHDHLAGDLRERLRALGILRAFGFLYVMPLGMSGHSYNSSC